jgi:hypothetical protein
LAWTAKNTFGSKKVDLPALLKPLTESTVALKAASAGSASDKPKTNIVLLAAYFVAWYALNVGYNITNKQVLNVFPLYATTAVAQLLVAWVWLIPQWITGIRPVPKPSKANMAALQKVSVLHGLGHLVTVRELRQQTAVLIIPYTF